MRLRDKLERDFRYSDENEKILSAYDKVLEKDLKEKANTTKKPVDIPKKVVHTEGSEDERADVKETRTIQEAYEQTILNPIVERKFRKKGKLKWPTIKKRLKTVKKHKKKKPKKTKDAFNRNWFLKKGKRVIDKMKKTLKRLLKDSVQYEDKIIALAQFLDIDPEEVEQTSWGYEADGAEYQVMSDSEADEACRQYIEDSIWAFNTWFLEQFIDEEDAIRYYGFETSYYDEDEDEEIDIDEDEIWYMNTGYNFTEWLEMRQQEAEGANDDLYSLVNASSGLDAFVDAAISADGRGHFMNTYDGEENEEIVNGSAYFIYRTN